VSHTSEPQPEGNAQAGRIDEVGDLIEGALSVWYVQPEEALRRVKRALLVARGLEDEGGLE
jgi:hypothetical protein